MILFWVVTGIAFALSFAFKFIGDAYFVDRISIIGNFFGVQLTHNSGIAFGMTFAGDFQLPLIILALCFVGYLAYSSERTLLNVWGFGLIVGGALANVADRIPDGLVTDFVRVGSFAVFNVADSCITVGVALLLLASLLEFWKKGSMRKTA